MSSPLRISSINNPSYVWTSISAAHKLLLLGITQIVNSGYEVNIWEDPWIPTTPSRPGRPTALVCLPKMRVSDLINGESKEKNVGLLKNYVFLDDIHKERPIHS